MKNDKVKPNTKLNDEEKNDLNDIQILLEEDKGINSDGNQNGLTGAGCTLLGC